MKGTSACVCLYDNLRAHMWTPEHTYLMDTGVSA